MPADTAPELRFGVAKEELTGLALTAGLVKCLGLAEALPRKVRLKQRRRGCPDPLRVAVSAPRSVHHLDIRLQASLAIAALAVQYHFQRLRHVRALPEVQVEWRGCLETAASIRSVR
jgi:hypothetical protein